MRYGLDVTCSHCGGEVHHVQGRSNQAPEKPGSHTTGVVECDDCHRSWMVDAVLRPFATTVKKSA